MKLLFVFAALLPVALCWVKEMENEGIYEGDIILSPDQQEEIKNGKLSFGSIRSKLWGRTIPYAFDSTISSEPVAMAAIKAAIRDYHRYTCLRFVPRRFEHAYLYFTLGKGCSSPVGKTGYRNQINLAKGCWNRATVIHEIGHSMGFYHEQSRPDRDDFLKIHLENVPLEKAHNFNKYPSYIIDSLGTRYDYHSVMHYNKNAFSKNKKMTMEPRDPYFTDLIGTGSGFSATDIKQFNLLYGCPRYTGPLPRVPTTECHDRTSYCEMYALKNKCVPYYMKIACPMSCGVCNGSPTERPSVVTKATTTKHVPTKAPVRTKAPVPGPCKDRFSRCHLLLKNCKLPDQRENMEFQCKKTCNFCDSTRTCFDISPSCKTMKDACSVNVIKYCKKTCKVCSV